MPSVEDLRRMQAWPLDRKIFETQTRIRQWHDHFGGNVYVSFSGGKDSTVLLDIARGLYPDMRAAFMDTGVEFPEIREFVRSFDNVDFVRPVWSRLSGVYGKKKGERKTYVDILTFYGYPLLSKHIARCIYEARRLPGGSGWKHLHGESGYEDGGRNMYDTSKYLPVSELPVMISEKCCAFLKKGPLKSWERKTGLAPLVGVMTDESIMRQSSWLQHGCNAYSDKRPMSQPMAFWTNDDVLEYIKTRNLSICSVYGDVTSEGCEGCRYRTTGCQRTGCVFCCFGVHMERGETKFQRLKRTHPGLYEYCMDGGEWKPYRTYSRSLAEAPWQPEKVWGPSKGGLGYARIFDWLNGIYGMDFLRYE